MNAYYELPFKKMRLIFILYIFLCNGSNLQFWSKINFLIFSLFLNFVYVEGNTKTASKSSAGLLTFPGGGGFSGIGAQSASWILCPPPLNKSPPPGLWIILNSCHIWVERKNIIDLKFSWFSNWGTDIPLEFLDIIYELDIFHLITKRNNLIGNK